MECPPPLARGAISASAVVLYNPPSTSRLRLHSTSSDVNSSLGAANQADAFAASTGTSPGGELFLQLDLSGERWVLGVATAGDAAGYVSQYRVEGSADGGATWEALGSASVGSAAESHHFLERAARARLVKLTRVASVGDGTFLAAIVVGRSGLDNLVQRAWPNQKQQPPSRCLAVSLPLYFFEPTIVFSRNFALTIACSLFRLWERWCLSRFLRLKPALLLWLKDEPGTLPMLVAWNRSLYEVIMGAHRNKERLLKCSVTGPDTCVCSVSQIRRIWMKLFTVLLSHVCSSQMGASGRSPVIRARGISRIFKIDA